MTDNTINDANTIAASGKGATLARHDHILCQHGSGGIHDL